MRAEVFEKRFASTNDTRRCVVDAAMCSTWSVVDLHGRQGFSRDIGKLFGPDVAMLQIHSFPPIASPLSRVLILGTMPGKASLRARQYYAHPQNAFWRIIGEILGFDPASPYDIRVASVQSAGVAIWDVLKSCIRASSLDSAIEAASAVPNDFAGFLAEHPQIQRICFNGAKAEALYMKHVRPSVPTDIPVQYLRLPSTSPANASLPSSEKLRAWRAIVL
jgi:double-stranded uracil-DNA glycosylase